MRMDKLTTKFQQALQDAQSLAVGRDHQFIEPVHLMAALLEQEAGTVGALLSKAGVDLNRLRSQLGEAIDRVPTVQGAAGDVHVSGELGKVLNIMDKLAQQRGDSYIASELFILAAMQARGDLGRILEQAGAVKSVVEKAIQELSGDAKVDDAGAEDVRQALQKYTIDLTERAEQGKLDPGRSSAGPVRPWRSSRSPASASATSSSD
jgi:ATP-dependent Clp protease ATP-binding subunit ClpB